MVQNYRITLLFNANKVYDRQVMEGIGEYLQASQSQWDVFLEEDFVAHLENFKHWKGDGVIADFDDPKVEAMLAGLDIPVVGVGGSYEETKMYPDVPYVATDNRALVEGAFEHLRRKGLQHFAFYGLPHDSSRRWASERERAFRHIMNRERYRGSVYLGNETNSKTWQYDMNRLSDWLQNLPTATGIIATTDSRARHLLQVCERLKIMVPDKVSIIGIDNEELARFLTRVSLSSVGQGCKSMGYQAAKMLHKLIKAKQETPEYNYSQVLSQPRLLVGPTKVYERQSTDFIPMRDPHVIQAMHYIRHNACKGIKVEQVLDHVRVSRSNLENRFKLELGQSIHSLIHNSKLQHAQNLLNTTSLPIAEIAELCGYPSLQYMYSVFKKNLSQTPKDYRESSTKLEDVVPNALRNRR